MGLLSWLLPKRQLPTQRGLGWPDPTAPMVLSPEIPGMGPVVPETLIGSGVEGQFRRLPAGAATSMPFLVDSLGVYEAEQWKKGVYLLYGDTPVRLLNSPATVGYAPYDSSAMGTGVAYDAQWQNLNPVRQPAGLGYGQTASGPRPQDLEGMITPGRESF